MHLVTFSPALRPGWGDFLMAELMIFILFLLPPLVLLWRRQRVLDQT
jgi:hypothetical protein